jgi:hypothetical protein
MHLKENGSKGGKRPTEEEARAEFRDSLSRWLHNAVAVLREEVPREAWPRVAARLRAAGVVVPTKDA